MPDLVHPKRGQIYWVEWTPHRGSEQTGTRPSLVISNDVINRNFTVCTVVAITTKVKPSQIAVTLPAAVTGEESQIIPWQVMTISDTRLEDLITTLSDEWMIKVEASLRIVWGL